MPGQNYTLLKTLNGVTFISNLNMPLTGYIYCLLSFIQFNNYIFDLLILPLDINEPTNPNGLVEVGEILGLKFPTNNQGDKISPLENIIEIIGNETNIGNKKTLKEIFNIVEKNQIKINPRCNLQVKKEQKATNSYNLFCTEKAQGKDLLVGIFSKGVDKEQNMSINIEFDEKSIYKRYKIICMNTTEHFIKQKNWYTNTNKEYNPKDTTDNSQQPRHNDKETQKNIGGKHDEPKSQQNNEKVGKLKTKITQDESEQSNHEHIKQEPDVNEINEKYLTFVIKYKWYFIIGLACLVISFSLIMLIFCCRKKSQKNIVQNYKDNEISIVNNDEDNILRLSKIDTL